MSDKLLGYVTIRIPIFEVTESESWEIPEEYTYLSTGESELVSHDIPARYHEWLIPSEQMLEWEIAPENWTHEEITATYTPSDKPLIHGDELPSSNDILLRNVKK